MRVFRALCPGQFFVLVDDGFLGGVNAANDFGGLEPQLDFPFRIRRARGSMNDVLKNALGGNAAIGAANRGGIRFFRIGGAGNVSHF